MLLIPGLGHYHGLDTPVTISYQTQTSSTTNASSYSFATQAIGTAASDRLVVVSIAIRDDGNGSPTVGGCTIGGVTATGVGGSAYLGIGQGELSLWHARVPTGTTGTIAVNAISQTCERCSIGVWALYNVKFDAPLYTSGDFGTNNSFSIDAFYGAAGIATMMCPNPAESATGVTVTAGSTTERFDVRVESAMRHFGSDTGTAWTSANPYPSETWSFTNTGTVGTFGAVWR